ncbi:aldo/keto reductase [Streptantibioticus silvisoli]|uniref:Aldo/keto reductase n=1 Tax=Streptantibioticus silvisoli TaxID=2705255 RepID=A0ABT6VYX2_9ACTN|nr:aldo/keto reductase [Streptantibioticus silvisoli]MDI5963244.1 aldo/keto reductase [Streptantibioticus silvisoli]
MNAVRQLAEIRDMTMAQVAVAWVLRDPLVSAPHRRRNQAHHLQQAAEARRFRLTDEEAATLEASYANAGPSWF